MSVEQAKAMAEAARVSIETTRLTREVQREAQRQVDAALREAQREIEQAQRELIRQQAQQTRNEVRVVKKVKPACRYRCRAVRRGLRKVHQRRRTKSFSGQRHTASKHHDV